MTVTVHNAIATALIEHGVTTMFGLIGDANLFMVDSFVRSAGGRFVAAAHENSAVMMAVGFAQVTGGTGVATVTHGPGLTNITTGLCEAVRSRTAVVILCGDTPAGEREHLQKIDQRELIAATGAGFEQMRSPQSALEDLGRVFRRAELEQRPIVLNMPIDYQWVEIAHEKVAFRIPDARIHPADDDQLEEALGMIAAAKRPVILAGRGAIGCRRDLVALARRLQAPLSTTLRASGLFRGEPENLGVFGTLSTPVATDAILASDCVLAFGAGLNMFTGGRGTFLKDKRIVQVDIDPARLAQWTTPTIGIVGDSGIVARTIIERFDEAEIGGSGFFDDDMARAIASYRSEPELPGYTGEQAAGTIDLRQALKHLDAAMPADRNVVTDLGRFVAEAWKAFPVPEPSALIHTVSFGSIGLGLPAAVGAAVDARRPTILITGDGGLLMSGFAEFNTAWREQLDLVVVVCSDGSYGAEHRQFRDRGMDPGISMFNWPDFAPIAQALGFDAVQVRNKAELELAAHAISVRHRPLLIDLKLDPERIPWG